jgi:excinuclease UvrABC helicase subunit UvrB
LHIAKDTSTDESDSSVLETTEIVLVIAEAGDSTLAIAKSFENKFPNIKIIYLNSAVGKGRDIQIGMLAASGELRIFMDADLATPLHHLETVFRKWQESKFDVLIGINLLREGLDLPEVSLVAILDADKEGFLRSERSLIQTIGRAARNINGKVILYADKTTESMKKAISETNRRRQIQMEYNKVNGITPQSIKKNIASSLSSIFEADYAEPTHLDKKALEALDYKKDPDSIEKQIWKLKAKMKKLAQSLEFEEAAKIRDEIKRLELEQMKLMEGPISKSDGHETA